MPNLTHIVVNGKGYIAKVQTDEQERTGIKKLKIGYNRVFGYYIEVPNSFKELVPEEYIRKQTLANCERYITSELKDLESKVLGAQERIVKLEYEIFTVIRKKVADEFSEFRKLLLPLQALTFFARLQRFQLKTIISAPSLRKNLSSTSKTADTPLLNKCLRIHHLFPMTRCLTATPIVAQLSPAPTWQVNQHTCVR